MISVQSVCTFASYTTHTVCLLYCDAYCLESRHASLWLCIQSLLLCSFVAKEGKITVD